MSANALQAVTVLDVLFLLLSVFLALTLYQAGMNVDERVARTRGAARAAWISAGVALIGGGLWLLSLTTTLPLLPGDVARWELRPGLLGAAIAVTAVGATLVLAHLERARWLRIGFGGLLLGSSFTAVHFLALVSLGWTEAARRQPEFSAQVLGAALAGAVLILWAALADRERFRYGRWARVLGFTTALLAAPAAVYSAFIGSRRATPPVDSERITGSVLLDLPAILIVGGIVLGALAVLVMAAGVDRRVRRRREETEALRRSEDRFRSLIQASSQIVWTTDPDGEMHGEQPSWSHFTGQDQNAYRGWGWFNAVHPEDREGTAGIWQASLANRKSVEVEHRVRRFDGQYRACVARMVPVLEPSGRVREWVGTHTDVTERARMQEERDLLANAGRVLSSSLDERETLSAIAGLLVPRLADWCAVDIRTPEGRIERVVAAHSDPHRTTLLREIQLDEEGGTSERGAARVLAAGESELFREVDEEVLSTIAVDEEDHRRLREVGVASLLMVPLIARRQVLGVVTLALAEEGEPYDLRDLALAEELARRSAIAIDNARLYSASRAAIQARDEVLSIVSHDLRNPLSTIMMTSDLLLDLPPAPEEQRRHLQTIGRAATAMNRLIRDLLDAGQAESGRLAMELKPLEPGALARESYEAMTPLAAEKGQKLECDVEEELPTIAADAARLQQVLSNLLGNAVKFVPEGGSIRLRVATQAGGVLFSVMDSGPGIPAEDLPHVFDRHWRGKETAHLGSGLGLAICKAIVEGHGGSIWAESEPGSGTAFHFTVPPLAEGAGEPAMTSRNGDDARGNKVLPPRVSPDQRPGAAADAGVHLLAGDR